MKISRVQRSTVFLAIAMLLVTAIGLVSYKTNGFSLLRPEQANDSMDQFAWNYQTNAECLGKAKTKPMFCIQLGNPQRITVGILGDSTANSLVPGLAAHTNARDEGIINIGYGSCAPIRGLLPSIKNPPCPEVVEDSYRLILEDKNISTVILAFFTNDLGALRVKDLPDNAPIEIRMNRLMTMLDADIKALNAAGKKVILTYDTPLSSIDARECMGRPFSHWLGTAKKCSVAEADVPNRHPQIDLLDKHYLGRSDVCVFHQSPLLFTNGYMNFKDSSGRFLIRDRHHLSVYGSEEMIKLMQQSPCAEKFLKN